MVRIQLGRPGLNEVQQGVLLDAFNAAQIAEVQHIGQVVFLNILLERVQRIEGPQSYQQTVELVAFQNALEHYIKCTALIQFVCKDVGQLIGQVKGMQNQTLGSGRVAGAAGGALHSVCSQMNDMDLMAQVVQILCKAGHALCTYQRGGCEVRGYDQ